MTHDIRTFLDPNPHTGDLATIADRIGVSVAGPASTSVDSESRFPHETFEALRQARMLSVLIPIEFGGAGANLVDVGRAVERLSRHCASSAMVYAMHHIQVAALARHGRSAWARDYVQAVAHGELLLASATTETGVGGDVRSSICAVQYDESHGGFHIEKDAPVVSYGAHADAVLATARRTVGSPASDQVLVVLPTIEGTLEQRSVWNALGFRGTCSHGFVVRGTGDVEQILTDPYADISARTMLPTSHVLWASVWLGLAGQAVDIARRYVRAQARKQPGVMPPAARHLAELVGRFEEFGAITATRTQEYAACIDDDDHCSSMGFALRMNALKVSASTLVVEIVSKAMTICGISAYLEDSPYSLGRLLRDAHGAALMVNNDRLIDASAQMLLVHKEAQ